MDVKLTQTLQPYGHLSKQERGQTHINLKIKRTQKAIAQSAGAVEYTDYMSADR